MKYYVSNNGNDINSGKNPNEAFKTITHALSLNLYPNDYILLENGSIFYEKIDIPTSNGIIISNYGTNPELPKIRGCKIINSENAWINEGNHIYSCDLTDTNNFDGIQEISEYYNNVGFIYDFNTEKIYGNRKFNLSDLQNQFDFYCENGKIYVYSSENPYFISNNIALPIRLSIINLRSNTKIENICIELTGAHAIRNDMYNSNYSVIRNCIIQNIGGSVHHDEVRYGNGIEFFIPSNKAKIYNNIIKNVYDVAFTCQNRGNYIWQDNEFYNNTIINCNQGCEYWSSETTSDGYGFINQSIYNNTFINIGNGWSKDVRPDKYCGSVLLFYNLSSEYVDVKFQNNIIYNPYMLYHCNDNYINKFINLVKSDNNIIFMDSNTYLLGHNNNYYYDYFPYNMNEFITLYNKDKFSEIYSLSNNNYEINDILNQLTAFNLFNNKINLKYNSYKEKINEFIMTKLSSNYTVQQADTKEQINLVEEFNNSDDLIIEDGAITCKRNGYLDISGCLKVNTTNGETNKLVEMIIDRDTTEVASVGARYNSANPYSSVTLPSIIVRVFENQKIKLNVKSPTVGTVIGSGTVSYLKVQYIDKN